MAEKIAKIIKINEDDFVLDKEKNPIKITNAFRKNGFKVGDGIKYELTNTLKIIAKVDLEYVNSQDKTEKKSNYNNKNSEKKHNENDTNEKKYIDDNREINLDRDYYPYNFVSLGDPSKTERHEVKKGKFSGKIKCSLKNLTPLFIGGNEENNGECTLITEVEKYSETAEGKEYKYTIPASTIKGELRNIIEVLTRSCIKNVEEERLTYRYQMKKNGRTNIFGVIHKLPTNNDPGKIIRADKIKIKKSILPSKYQKSGFYLLKVVIDSPFVKDCIRRAKQRSDYERGKDDPNAINDVDNFEKLQRNGIKNNAILWVGSHTDNKKYEKILIFDEDKRDDYYSFSKAEYDDLQFLIDERVGNEKKDKKIFYIDKVKENDAVIFEKEEDVKLSDSSFNLKKNDVINVEVENKNVKKLAFSEIPRLKYKCKPIDLVPKGFRPCNNIEELCFACRLFGTIGDNSKKAKEGNVKKESFSIASRISITDALSIYPQNDVKEENVILKSLGEPHPTLLRFYLKYGDYDKEYEEGKYEIRGRKFYWHHTNKIKAGENYSQYIESFKDEKISPTNSEIKFLKPLQEFEFEINFRDLTEEELGILLYSIEVEEEKSLHKIGKAKAYGFGSCEIKIDKCLIETENKYVSFDKNDSFKEYSKEEYTKEFIKKAKDKYSLDSDEREEIIELKYILNKESILKFPLKRSPFPEEEKYNSEEKRNISNTLNWFSSRKGKTYNLPTISNYIKEAEKRKGKK